MACMGLRKARWWRGESYLVQGTHHNWMNAKDDVGDFYILLQVQQAELELGELLLGHRDTRVCSGSRVVVAARRCALRDRSRCSDCVLATRHVGLKERLYRQVDDRVEGFVRVRRCGGLSTGARPVELVLLPVATSVGCCSPGRRWLRIIQRDGI